jgi:hypothetical protein
MYNYSANIYRCDWEGELGKNGYYNILFDYMLLRARVWPPNLIYLLMVN